MNKLCLLLLILLCSTSFCFAEGEPIPGDPQPLEQIQAPGSIDATKNTATLIIMRVSGAIGWTVSLSSPLFVNGLLTDALAYYHYTSCEVPPGKVKLSSYNTMHYNEYIFDVSPGETYYINFYMVTAAGASRPEFELMDKDVAIEKLKKCKKTEY